jgi:lipid-A-disaccharide synthase
MIIAGEVSGDLHGSGVVRELKRIAPDTDIYGIGGHRMKAEGMDLLFHIGQVSVMGFVEVIRHLPRIRQIQRQLVECLNTRRPQVVILIDFPGFNLRFARAVKDAGIRVLYYISPQVWAWHKGRVRTMKNLVDQMDVVFPFEVEIYRSEGVPVEFVGHPLLERLGECPTKKDFFQRYGLDPAKKLVALLPGSRVQEIKSILPVMVQASGRLARSTGAQVALGLAPGLDKEIVRSFLDAEKGIHLIEQGTYGLMQHADAVVVTSGTATLETALFSTPMVVVYRTSAVTYLLGRLLVKVPWIALANIVAGKKVVPELIQGQMTAARVAAEVEKILADTQYAMSMRRELRVVRERLGIPGASSRVARHAMTLTEAA